MSFPSDKAFTFLQRARESGRLAHAYLFTGPEGAGKRRLAAQVAGELVQKPAKDWPPPAHPDVHLIEPESKSRRIVIDQIRTVEHSLRLRPAMAPLKVAIIVDADRLQPQAANAFLKTLEEPPSDTHLLLLSAHPEMILTTILSRCLRVPLSAPPAARELSKAESELLDRAGRCFASPRRTVAALLGLSHDIQAHLSARKEAIRKSLDARLKEEKAAWADNIDRGWIEQREEHFEAVGDASYRVERERLLLLLCEWWGDALRTAANAGRLRFEAEAPRTAQCARTAGVDGILAAIERLDALRDALGRNAQESLAFDAGLLGLVSRS